MSGIQSLIRLVWQIIKSPIKTIKSSDIICYDKDAILRTFAIVSSVFMILATSLNSEELSIGSILLVGVLGPLVMFLFYKITTVLFYAIFKLLGKGIEVSYDSIKTVLYPIFLTMLIIDTFATLVTQALPFGGPVLLYVGSLWFYIMIFFVLRFKLRQTITRSLVVLLIPLLIAIIPRVLAIVNNL